MTRTTLTPRERQRAASMIVLAVAGLGLSLAGGVTVIVIARLTPETPDASGTRRLVWALIATGVVLSAVLAALAVAVLVRFRQRD